MSRALAGARRIVVKVGSSLVTNEGRGVDAEAIGNWCRQLAALAAEGREVVMVSSGAIAEGMKRLGWATRPTELHELQAAAAVGQMGLVQMYESKLREQWYGQRPGPADPCRPGRSRALPQCPFHFVDPAAAPRAAGHQRERHGRQRRNQVRRQRHPGRSGGQSDRGRCAGHFDRPEGPVLRRPAPRSERAVHCRGGWRAHRSWSRWPAVLVHRWAVAA